MDGWKKQFALRELQGEMRNWIVGWFLASLLCVIVGPFDTGRLGIGPRAVYWFGTNAVALFIMFLVLRALAGMGVAQFWRGAILGSLIFSALFTPAVMMLNAWLLDVSLTIDASLFVVNFAIAIVVNGVIWLALPNNTEQELVAAPTFHNRLSQYKNAKILALRAQDHYLKVITDQGAELILIRMADAVAELGQSAGIQIHRSHWVARDGVEKISGADVVLVNGEVLRISRSNLKAVQKYFAPLSATR